MEIANAHYDGIPLLRVTGDVDHSHSAILDRAVWDAIKDGDKLLIDLSGCDYMDSGGLAVLLFTVKRLPPGGWVGLVGSNRFLVRLFEIVGLTTDRTIRLFDDLSQIAEVPAESAG